MYYLFSIPFGSAIVTQKDQKITSGCALRVNERVERKELQKEKRENGLALIFFILVVQNITDYAVPECLFILHLSILHFFHFYS